MTDNIQDQTPNNRKMWFTLSGIAVAVILGLFLVMGFASNSSDHPHETGSATNQATNSSLPTPTITTVTTSNKAQDIVFSVKVAGIDTGKYTLEYEVADQDRVVQAQGKAHSSEFDASTKLTNSAYYRIKVRSTDSNGTTGAWSDSYTVKLSDLSTFKTLQPDPAFYRTGWATGTDTSMSAAKQAISKAWGIQEVTTQSEASRCLPINTGDMAPKLLLPPMPSVMPKSVTLKFMMDKYENPNITITYLWCE